MLRWRHRLMALEMALTTSKTATLERPAATLGSIGPLEARLAASRAEIGAAQALRYAVFFDEGGATPDGASAAARRDICAFDDICDHVIVVDRDANDGIVGAYRLLRQEAAGGSGFYSAAEFDVAPLVARHRDKHFLELGRSCVRRDWRNKRTLELMWRAIWKYARRHRVDVMMGCASFPGVDPHAHASALGYLWTHHRGEAAWRVTSRDPARIELQSYASREFDPRRAFAALPPLIKGYLRLGAKVGEHAVIDHRFGVTDVFIVLPVEGIDQRYIDYYTDPPPDA
jgi:putative hemolysin